MAQSKQPKHQTVLENSGHEFSIEKAIEKNETLFGENILHFFSVPPLFYL